MSAKPPPGLLWKGEPPNGVLTTYRLEASAETVLRLDGEEIGRVSDYDLAMMGRAPIVVDWDAWRASKLTVDDRRP